MSACVGKIRLQGLVKINDDGTWANDPKNPLYYLIRERQLKHKRTGTLYRRLPPLETLDRLAVATLTIGFPSTAAGSTPSTAVTSTR